MRTTLTLDADVQQLVERAMRERRAPMKAVINDALRMALGRAQQPRPYRVDVHHSPLAPGVDPGRLNQLADELDQEAFLWASAEARSS